MRALFANYFLPLFAKNLFRFCITRSRIQDRPILYVYGIDKIACRHLQKLPTFCIAWPDRLIGCTNISRVILASFRLF